MPHVSTCITPVSRAIMAAWPQPDISAHEADMTELAALLEHQLLDAAPMSLVQCLDLALFAHTAVQALQTGQATDVDANNLAMISNIAMLLAECGYGADALDDIVAGQNAVRAVLARQDRTGRTGCSGLELQAIREMVDLHDQQLHLGPTQREMSAVIAEMRRRMADGEVMA